MSDLTRNPKKFHRYVKSKSQKASGLPDLKEGEKIISNDLEKAELMGSFFQSVQTSEPPLSPDDPLIYGPARSPVPILTINPNGVLKLLLTLKTTKSGGCDGISPLVLKQTAPVIFVFLSALFSNSLSSGELPDDWKRSRIHPIHKKGSRSDKANYRPIALTCIACKIFEHIIHSHIMRHLQKQNIIDERQHGFREGHSCETQILSILESWTKSLDERADVLAILLDFSKAFDSVPHERLLIKCEHYGINGNLLKWIRAFLTGRNQFVSVSGTDSPDLPVRSGVPQGSVLGPLLFMLFINDISNGVKSPLHLFADDSIVFRSIKTDEDLEIVQSDLNVLNEWSSHWLLRFNATKSQQITIRQGNAPYHPPHLQLDGVTLSSFSEVTYLGIVIDDHLRWNKHIDKICAAANRKLGFLRRHFSEFCQDAKILLYNSHVLSKLEYCATVWDPHTAAGIEKLEAVHNKGTRFVTRKYSWHESVSRLRESVKFETLAVRRRSTRLDRLQKFRGDELPILYADKPSLLNDREGMVTRRSQNTNTLYEEPCRLDCRKFSFLPRTVRDYNLSLV